MDKQTAIVKQAVRLPVETRKLIANAIIQSIDRDETRMSARERLGQLVALGEQVIGCEYNPDKKGYNDTLVRNLCAKAMREEGYTFSDIGRAMNRHYSSTIVMCRRADEMGAGYFGADCQDKYKQFFKQL